MRLMESREGKRRRRRTGGYDEDEDAEVEKILSNLDETQTALEG